MLFYVPRNHLIIGLILVLISAEYYKVGCAVPPRNRHIDKENPLDPITLEDYLKGDLRHRDFLGQWSQDSDNLIRIFKADAVVNYNIKTGKEEVVVYIKNITDQLPPNSPFTNIIFSNDGNFALIEHGRSSVWRYSALAKYGIFDIKSRKLTSQLIPAGEFKEQPQLQLVKWSPTGNGIAFVYKYNVYYKADANPETPVRQITFDGDEETAIYNGISDWVYEEEMFGSPNALWISNSGKNLAFVKFNDSLVEEFQWPIYGEPGSTESIYPSYRKIRYPKTGTPNPDADVYIISLTDPNSQARKVTYKETSEKDRHIVGTVLWGSESELVVATLNREQNVSHFHLCPADSAECSQIYSYKLNHGWVDMNTPKASKDGQSFLFIRSQMQDSGKESFKHIVKFGTDKISQILTKGRLSVNSILGWDEANNRIFFTGTFWNGTHADPSESHVYTVIDDGSNTTPKCLTCNLRNSFNETCRDNSVLLSGAYTHFIHRCSGPGVPESITRLTKDGSVVDNPGPTFITNANVRELLEKKGVPLTRDYDIPVGDGFFARARLYLPPDFDESEKYPILISVYGGPGSQNVGQGYSINWETSLVSDKKVISGYIDGRGTSGSSTNHLFTVHRRLGTFEVEDQITATKWLINKLPFIDPAKTSIWGWSYGGFATGRVLETDVENVFKCGISVAPVTSWRYYDTIYTERYMGLPTEDDNLEAYESSDLTNKDAMENLRNKTYMIIHGNADDNVHYQQSMVFARALEQNDIYFHQLSYPDENHAIAGPGMRKHLYHSLQRFLFDECYKISENPNQRSSANSATANLQIFLISFLIMIYNF